MPDHRPDGDADRPVRVVVAAHGSRRRARLAAAVRGARDLAVVASASDVRGAAAAARAEEADVVLLPVRLPGGPGITGVSAVTAARSIARVLVLGRADDKDVADALRGGAAGFLAPSAPAYRLVAAIRAVHHGDPLVSPAATVRLLATHGAGPPRPGVEPLAGLTERERAVLGELGRGGSDAEIARLLGTDHATAGREVTRLLARLALRGRAQAVVLAHECGLGGTG